ncbi:MAG: type IV pilus twitching motility protein PilT [Planctomycetota bacterium]
MYDLDTFAEKVLLHNNVVTRPQLEEARQIAREYAGSTLIDGLINVGALDATHAKGILQDYERWRTAQEAKAAAKQASRAAAPVGGGGNNNLTPRPAGADGGGGGNVMQSGRLRMDYVQQAADADDLADDDDPGMSVELDVRPATIVAPQGNAQADYLNQLLAHARKMGASDLHLKTKCPPVVRKNGSLLHFQTEPFKPGQTEAILTSILNDQQKALLRRDKSIEFSYSVPNDGRYRSSIVQQRTGFDGSFRILQNRIPTFEELGLPEQCRRLSEYNQGLVLVTGPGGSGKSTTLAAMIELCNVTRQDHIVTIEDPIEYQYTPKKAQINQREVGLHTAEFDVALRSAFREDPDVIMIGELRDRETVSLAVTAAETGHLVFGTLDTNTAARTVDRILEVFPPEEQGQVRSMVSESLRGIICQQLIPRKDGAGRVLALEVMFNTAGISNLIREDKVTQIPALMQMGKAHGMILMDNYLQYLLENDVIDGAEAWYASNEKVRFGQFSPTGW